MYMLRKAHPLIYTVYIRLIYMPDFLERRSVHRELYHQVRDGGCDEEVGAAD